MTQEKFITLSPEEQKKWAFANILEFITNNFYSTPEYPITVRIDNTGKGNNYFDQHSIVLSSQLIDAFAALNLPRFVIYYHELGHLLYSEGYFRFIETWCKIDAGPLKWDEKYQHLFNWIEDYYIESRLLTEHKYLSDVMSCILKLKPDYDIKRIEYAFNYWYTYKAPTPALAYMDQVTFKTYITQLLTLRDYKVIPFGHGVLTNLAIRPSNDTRFAQTLVEFYNWCVIKKIFPDDQPLPSLSTPTIHLEPKSDDASLESGQQKENVSDDQDDVKNNDGSHSDHSHQVGKPKIEYVSRYHIKTATDLIKDELVQENTLINKEILDMSQRLQADQYTIDGLFTNKYRKTATIQNKIVLPNFYNPNRLIDQVLFKKRKHTYMNVAIYRDISGSTSGSVHGLMHYVCEQLMKDIPVDVTYYLYSSGQISIIEVPYIPWEKCKEVPSAYVSNPLFAELNGGTNSSAIADVITQQLSDKWLNIIITDGDLTDLMMRDNIMALLKNVFVISVNSDVEPGLLGIRINDKEDITKISTCLSSIQL